VTEDRTRE